MKKKCTNCGDCEIKESVRRNNGDLNVIYLCKKYNVEVYDRLQTNCDESLAKIWYTLKKVA